jgi:hypothetical protein
MGDRAKEAILWPDPSRNGRKLAEIANLRPGREHLKIPANKPNSGLANAWIAPRRSPVRVRLAPSHEIPVTMRVSRLLGSVRLRRGTVVVGPVFGPISAPRVAPQYPRSPISSRFGLHERLRPGD